MSKKLTNINQLVGLEGQGKIWLSVFEKIARHLSSEVIKDELREGRRDAHNQLDSFSNESNGEVENLQFYNNITTAKGKWLDYFGELLEIPRISSHMLLASDSDEKKRSKDNSYRLILLAKISSIYDDFTYNAFVELSKVLELNEKFNFFIFSDMVLFVFFDLETTAEIEKNGEPATRNEISYLQEHYELLYSFNLGKNKMRIDYGLEKTFLFGRNPGFGLKLGFTLHEKDF